MEGMLEHTYHTHENCNDQVQLIQQQFEEVREPLFNQISNLVYQNQLLQRETERSQGINRDLICDCKKWFNLPTSLGAVNERKVIEPKQVDDASDIQHLMKTKSLRISPKNSYEIPKQTLSPTTMIAQVKVNNFNFPPQSDPYSQERSPLAKTYGSKGKPADFGGQL